MFFEVEARLFNFRGYPQHPNDFQGTEDDGHGDECPRTDGNSAYELDRNEATDRIDTVG
jgi:hypothetical protein